MRGTGRGRGGASARGSAGQQEQQEQQQRFRGSHRGAFRGRPNGGSSFHTHVDPSLAQLRLLLEEGLVDDAYRILSILAPAKPPATSASAARHSNVLALCGTVSTVELSLKEKRWLDALEGIKAVEPHWATADVLAEREGRQPEEKGLRKERRREWTCRALEGLQRWEELVDFTQQADKFVPPFQSAISYLAVALYKLGRLHESYEAVSRTRPSDVVQGHKSCLARIRLAGHLDAVSSKAAADKKFDLAIEYLNEALEVDSGHQALKTRFLHARASAYLQSGNPLPALSDVASILELRPSDAAAFVTRARAHLVLNKAREALAACLEAGRLGGDELVSAERRDAEEMLRDPEEFKRKRDAEAAERAQRAREEEEAERARARAREEEEAYRAQREAEEKKRLEEEQARREAEEEKRREEEERRAREDRARERAEEALRQSRQDADANRKEKERRRKEREEEAARQAKREAEERARSPGSGAGTDGRPGGAQPGGAAGSGSGSGSKAGGGGRGGQPGARPGGVDPREFGKGHYATLELRSTATPAEIRSAYLRLSRLAHPDKGGSHVLFVRLKAAYDILVDPLSRRRYDLGTL